VLGAMPRSLVKAQGLGEQGEPVQFEIHLETAAEQTRPTLLRRWPLSRLPVIRSRATKRVKL
jgi:hypothetical protein